MKWIFWPDDPATGVDLGGKGLALWKLRNSGLHIPPWFALMPAAWEASMAVAGGIRRGSEEEMSGMSDTSETWPSEAVAAGVAAAVHRLCPEGGLVAVRSSAAQEDGAAASFAGQLESFLGVGAGDVRARVAAVWRSGFSPTVRAYRERHGLAPSTQAPTVIIQTMVKADVSGVVFGADPIDPKSSNLVIAAIPGLGLGLVGGATDAPTWRVDRSGRVLAHRPAVVSEAWRLAEHGVRREPCEPGTVVPPLLRDDQLAAITAAAITAENCLGGPQDMEWAIESGRLFILQARPITGLQAPVTESEPLAIWDNSNIIESYSGVTTPLTFSFARRAYEGVYREFCRLLAVPSARLAAHDEVFRTMLGLHRGRIYYHLLNWYRVLALLPGFTVNRRFMEQMMGVREPMPDAVLDAWRNARWTDRLIDACHLARSAAALVRHHFRLPRTIEQFRERLDDALRPPDGGSWESQETGALTQAFVDLERQMLRRWDAPLLNDFFTMIFFGLLRQTTARWQGGGAAPLHNDLLCDVGGLLSAEPARRLASLARLARDSGDGFVNLLSEGSVAAIDAAATRHAEFLAARDAYLAEFGERCFDELKLESPTLIDDPLPLYRAIGRLAASLAAQPPPAAGDALASHARLAAEAAMARALIGHPVRRLLFRWLVRHTQAGVRERENLRLERTRLFGRVRRIFLALGHRLHRTGVLAAADDVFYLEVDDVLRFVSGATTSVCLRDLAQVRRREFDAYRLSPALPDRFTTRGIPSENLPSTDLRTPGLRTTGSLIAGLPAMPRDTEDERSGLGCCPGVVRGRVCMVIDPAHTVVPAGAVLVAERTDPGWILLFPGAAGLLVERGSLLSHSAIVARELRLPTVVAVAGLTAWLRDGDTVEFDGASGRVRRLDVSDDVGAVTYATAPVMTHG